jgi:hypothetical protein
MTNPLLAALIGLCLCGCAGTNFNWDDTAKIQNGMTEPEVVAILGKPYSRAESSKATVLTYSYATAFGGARAVSYRLIDGRVTGAATVGK